METTNFFIDGIGWTGAALVLLAYGLISVQWISGKSLSYQVLNATGALLLVINSYYLEAYPSVGVNAAWVGIALIALFRDWWRGSSEAYKKVTLKLSKRINLQRITLKHIKLPAFRIVNHNLKRNQPSTNGFGQH